MACSTIRMAEMALEDASLKSKKLTCGRDKMCLKVKIAQEKRCFLQGSSEVRSAQVSL